MFECQQWRKPGESKVHLPLRADTTCVEVFRRFTSRRAKYAEAWFFVDLKNNSGIKEARHKHKTLSLIEEIMSGLVLVK